MIHQNNNCPQEHILNKLPKTNAIIQESIFKATHEKSIKPEQTAPEAGTLLKMDDKSGGIYQETEDSSLRNIDVLDENLSKQLRDVPLTPIPKKQKPLIIRIVESLIRFSKDLITTSLKNIKDFISWIIEKIKCFSVKIIEYGGVIILVIAGMTLILSAKTMEIIGVGCSYALKPLQLLWTYIKRTWQDKNYNKEVESRWDEVDDLWKTTYCQAYTGKNPEILRYRETKMIDQQYVDEVIERKFHESDENEKYSISEAYQGHANSINEYKNLSEKKVQGDNLEYYYDPADHPSDEEEKWADDDSNESDDEEYKDTYEQAAYHLLVARQQAGNMKGMKHSPILDMNSDEFKNHPDGIKGVVEDMIEEIQYNMKFIEDQRKQINRQFESLMSLTQNRQKETNNMAEENILDIEEIQFYAALYRLKNNDHQTDDEILHELIISRMMVNDIPQLKRILPSDEVMMFVKEAMTNQKNGDNAKDFKIFNSKPVTNLTDQFIDVDALNFGLPTSQMKTKERRKFTDCTKKLLIAPLPKPAQLYKKLVNELKTADISKYKSWMKRYAQGIDPNIKYMGKSPAGVARYDSRHIIMADCDLNIPQEYRIVHSYTTHCIAAIDLTWNIHDEGNLALISSDGTTNIYSPQILHKTLVKEDPAIIPVIFPTTEPGLFHLVTVIRVTKQTRTLKPEGIMMTFPLYNKVNDFLIDFAAIVGMNNKEELRNLSNPQVTRWFNNNPFIHCEYKISVKQDGVYSTINGHLQYDKTSLDVKGHRSAKVILFSEIKNFIILSVLKYIKKANKNNPLGDQEIFDNWFIYDYQLYGEALKTITGTYLIDHYDPENQNAVYLLTHRNASDLKDSNALIRDLVWYRSIFQTSANLTKVQGRRKKEGIVMKDQPISYRYDIWKDKSFGPTFIETQNEILTNILSTEAKSKECASYAYFAYLRVLEGDWKTIGCMINDDPEQNLVAKAERQQEIEEMKNELEGSKTLNVEKELKNLWKEHYDYMMENEPIFKGKEGPSLGAWVDFMKTHKIQNIIVRKVGDLDLLNKEYNLARIITFVGVNSHHAVVQTKMPLLDLPDNLSVISRLAYEQSKENDQESVIDVIYISRIRNGTDSKNLTYTDVESVINAFRLEYNVRDNNKHSHYQHKQDIIIGETDLYTGPCTDDCKLLKYMGISEKLTKPIKIEPKYPKETSAELKKTDAKEVKEDPNFNDRLYMKATHIFANVGTYAVNGYRIAVTDECAILTDNELQRSKKLGLAPTLSSLSETYYTCEVQQFTLGKVLAPDTKPFEDRAARFALSKTMNTEHIEKKNIQNSLLYAATKSRNVHEYSALAQNYGQIAKVATQHVVVTKNQINQAIQEAQFRIGVFKAAHLRPITESELINMKFLANNLYITQGYNYEIDMWGYIKEVIWTFLKMVTRITSKIIIVEIVTSYFGAIAGAVIALLAKFFDSKQGFGFNFKKELFDLFTLGTLTSIPVVNILGLFNDQDAIKLFKPLAWFVILYDEVKKTTWPDVETFVKIISIDNSKVQGVDIYRQLNIDHQDAFGPQVKYITAPKFTYPEAKNKIVRASPLFSWDQKFKDAQVEIEYDELMRNQKYILTGFNNSDHTASHPVETAKDSDWNTIYAVMYRAMRNNALHEEETMKDFLGFANIQSSINQIENELLLDTTTKEDYLKQIEPAKAQLYQKAEEENPDYYNVSHTMKMMMKRDELIPGKARPRNLGYKHAIHRYYEGVSSWRMMKATKTVFPEIVHGLTGDELQTRLQEQWDQLRDPYAISIDWSTFDVTRDSYKMMVDRMVSEIYPASVIGTGIEHALDSLWEHFNQPSRKIRVEFQDGQWVELIRKGLTSGDTQFTTRGNNVFAATACRYLTRYIPKEAVFSNVSGDDTVIFVEGHYVQQLKQRIEDLTFREMPETPTRKGIGMIIKYLLISNRYFSFLSKLGLINPDTHQISLTREYSRVRNMSNVMDKSTHMTPLEHKIATNYCHYHTSGDDLINSKAYVTPESRPSLNFKMEKKIEYTGTSKSNEMDVYLIANPEEVEIVRQYYHHASTIDHLKDIESRVQGSSTMHEGNSIVQLVFSPRYPWNTEKMQDGTSQLLTGTNNLLNTSTSTIRPQNWTPKQHTPEEIKAAQQILKESRAQKKNKINGFIKNRNTNPFYGLGPEQLIEAYRQHNAQLNETIKNLNEQYKPKDFTSSELGMSYAEKQAAERSAFAAEQDALAEKLGFIATGNELNKIKQKYGATDISNSKMRQLLLLDDFYPKMIAGVKKYLPILGEAAINQFLPGLGSKILELLKEHKLLSNPTVLDQAYNMSADRPLYSKNYIVSDLDTLDKLGPESAYVVTTNGKTGDMDTVAHDGLATMLCPERYQYRVTMTQSQKTGIISGEITMPVPTDAQGNAFVVVNPLNPAGDSAIADFFAGTKSWNPTTGATQVFTNNAPAPIINYTTSVKTVKVSGFACEFFASQSANNNQGSVHMAYLENYSGFNFSSTASDDCTLSSLAVNPYYISGNMNARYRMIYIPDDTDRLSNVLNGNAFTDGFIIGIVGAATNSSSVGIVKMTFVYECVPTQSASVIISQQNATSGPATFQALNEAIKKNTLIQQLPLHEAAELAGKIFNEGESLNYCKAVKIMSGHKYLRPYNLPVYAGKKEEKEEISFDFVSENPMATA